AGVKPQDDRARGNVPPGRQGIAVIDRPKQPGGFGASAALQHVDPIVVFADGKDVEPDAEAEPSERRDDEEERGESRQNKSAVENNRRPQPIERRSLNGRGAKLHASGPGLAGKIGQMAKWNGPEDQRCQFATYPKQKFRNASIPLVSRVRLRGRPKSRRPTRAKQ